MISSLAPEQKRQALEAVLGSETFARSDQLKSFLRFVCDMEAQGRGQEINEYLIGVEVLGRPEGYSPAGDSSVRTRAFELRQRLQRYYKVENPQALLRIELPKGSYAPRYVESKVPAAPPRPPWLEFVRGHRAALTLVFLTGLVVGLLCSGITWVILSKHPAPNELDPVLREAWGPLARHDANVLVCLGTRLHLLVSPNMDILPEGMPKYPAPRELYPLFRRNRPLPPDMELWMHPVQKAISMGEAAGVLLVSNVLRAAGAQFQVLPESDAPITSMRGRNVVLFGSPYHSDATSKLLERTHWTISYDPSLKESAICEQRGQGSPQPVYVSKRGPRRQYDEVYGLITVLPSQGARGESKRTVVFSGITSVGLHGAAEFFSTPAALRRLRERLGEQKITGFPAAYQVVVRCKSSEDTLLLSAEYQAHHILEQ